MAHHLGWDDQDVLELDKLQRFFQSEWPGGATVSTTVRVSILYTDSTRKLTVVLIAGTPLNELEVCDGSNTLLSICFRFTLEDPAVLQVVRELVDCPTLTYITLYLSTLGPRPTHRWHVFDDLVPQVFSVLSTRRSHSTAWVRFETGVPKPVKRCEDALVEFVARDTTLEKLEVGIYPIFFPDHEFLNQIGSKTVSCNRTFADLVRVLVPDAGGRQANTTLSTLKLSLGQH